MAHITKICSINASPKAVVEYIADVHHHPAFISALKNVENISQNPREPGSKWDWTFVMSGIEIKGSAVMEDYAPEKHYSFKTTSGVESTFSYTVEAEGEGSRRIIDVKYEMPDSVIAKVAEATVVERLNEDEAEQAGQNLKAILEG